MATYEQRRSIFLPPEAVERTRYTCRDEEGRCRLMPDVDLMDALEHLCRIEERSMGVLVQGVSDTQRMISEANKLRWEARRD
jgi:hypothetical protein